MGAVRDEVARLRWAEKQMAAAAGRWRAEAAGLRETAARVGGAVEACMLASAESLEGCAGEVDAVLADAAATPVDHLAEAIGHLDALRRHRDHPEGAAGVAIVSMRAPAQPGANGRRA
jgi:hypothetical protein